MGRLGVIGAGLVCVNAFAETATFTPLRGGPPIFATVGGSWRSTAETPPMSGDGTTVTDGRWRWTKSGGVVPTGFVPGYNQSSSVVRRPLGLSYDGTIEYGRLVGTPNSTPVAAYWEDRNQFNVYAFLSHFVPTRSLSDDGQWIVFQDVRTFPRKNYRMRRDGTAEQFPDFGQDSGIWGPTRSAENCLSTIGVYRIAAGRPAHEAALQPSPLSTLTLSALTSDGRLAAGLVDSGAFGAIWNTQSGQIELFNQPLGTTNLNADVFLSESGDIVFGGTRASGLNGQQRVFVRRAGEQARELRVVLDRFGDTSSNYYVLERAVGISRDGKTLLVLYSSPLWYGDGAAIVTLPDWEPCPADLNFDGVVDDADFSIFAGAYDRLTTTDGDLNVDRFTDDSDFSIFASAYDRLVCD